MIDWLNGLSNEVFIPLVLAGGFACFFLSICLAAEIWYRWDNVVVGALLWFVAIFLIGSSLMRMPDLLEREDSADRAYRECLSAAQSFEEYDAC